MEQRRIGFDRSVVVSLDGLPEWAEDLEAPVRVRRAFDGAISVLVDGDAATVTANGRSSPVSIDFAEAFWQGSRRRVAYDRYDGSGVTFCSYVLPWQICTVSADDPLGDPVGMTEQSYFFERRIGMFGAACSGKTTAARAVAAALNVDFGVFADTPYEAASEWIQQHGRPDFNAQAIIIERQRSVEDLIQGSGKIVVSDSPFPLCGIYARFYGGAHVKFTPAYFRMTQVAAMGMCQYSDQVLLLPMPWVDDGIRYSVTSVASAERDRLHNMLLVWMEEFGRDFMTVDWAGNTDANVSSIVKRFFRLSGRSNGQSS